MPSARRLAPPLALAAVALLAAACGANVSSSSATSTTTTTTTTHDTVTTTTGADGSGGGTTSSAGGSHSGGAGGAGPCIVYGQATKACQADGDCGWVALGCYCGPQPAIGIGKAFAEKAAACEQESASHCELGCAVQMAHRAEDGTTDEDGGAVAVHCKQGECATTIE
jgi:hypothetical protein